MQTELFIPEPVLPADLDQYFTPEWAACEIVETFYPDLAKSDCVLEPACGRGSFLKAIPDCVPAIGIEIDAELAAFAGDNTGRQIIVGDFRVIDVECQPTVIIGNPPFKKPIVDQFLERARNLLPDNGQCGFLLPVYAIQTPSRVLRWNEDWSLMQNIIPRTLFPRARYPLVFLQFTKDKLRRLIGGFALYRQSDEVARMRPWAKLILVNGVPRQPTWRALVAQALSLAGGKAHVQELYRLISPVRRQTNQWWREKVRQTLQRHFISKGNGVWAAA